MEALKQENSSLLAGDGTNRSIDSSGSSIRRVGLLYISGYLVVIIVIALIKEQEIGGNDFRYLKSTKPVKVIVMSQNAVSHLRLPMK